MESLFLRISDTASIVFDTVWLPLLIWTVISFTAWVVLRVFEKVHPVYQYHTRMALIFSLPAGLFFLIIVNEISNWMTASADAGLKIITMTSPLDITFIPAEESTGIPLISLVQASLFLLIIVGAIFFMAKFFIQAHHLRILRGKCSLKPISEVEYLTSENLGLAMATRKKVTVAYLKRDIVPVTFGFRNPVILLPETLRDEPGKLNLAIRHELSHITQHDFFSHLMVIITESLFWFHPLVHRLKRELVEYREIRCDHMVLSENSVSRKEYASLLLELIPMPNIDKNLSVNMAQESSNLKKRITMITQQKTNKPIPKKSSLALLGTIFLTIAIVMACTDMQTQNVFDEEDLDLMTNIDRSGEQGYHEIIIYMSEEEQADRHESKLEQLRMLEPQYIESIHVWKGDQAVENFGSRGEKGVIQVRTKLDAESYNNTLRALGMNPVNPESLTPQNNESTPQDDFFVVVEEMPELIGGLASVQREIRYPEMARRAGIEGRVFVQFIVNEQGDVENPQIIRGIGGGADEEALRVVRQAKFTPGMQRGRAVRVQYSLPIFFKLQGSENTPEQSNLEPRENRLNEMTVTGYGGNNQSRTQVDPESSTRLGRSAEMETSAAMEKRMIVEVQNENGQIRGKVLDGNTQQPLAGASVILSGTNAGTSTDINGNFSIDTDGSDEYELIFSYIGYERASLSITR
jgi:TonB family protein